MRPGLRMPCGSNAAFTRRVMRGERRRLRRDHVHRGAQRVRAAHQRPGAAGGRARPAATAAWARRVAGEPDQAAAPVEESAARAGSIARARAGAGRRAHRTRQIASPGSAAAARHRAPPARRRGWPRRPADRRAVRPQFGAQPAGAVGRRWRRNPRCGPARPSAPNRPAPAPAPPPRPAARPRRTRRRASRARRTAPRTPASASRPGSTSVPVRSGAGSTFSVISVMHAQRAVAAGQQLAEVEPGDVLQHAAAGVDHLARPVHRAHAQHVVAHGAPGDPARAGQVGRDHAAQRLRACSRRAGRTGRAARRSGAGRCSASAASISAAGCRRGRK